MVANDLTYDDKKTIEDYACANTGFKYEETEFFEKIGQEPYQAEVNFDFNCEILHFIDDKIRVRFFNNKMIG